MTPSLCAALLEHGGDLRKRLPELKVLYLCGEVVTQRLFQALLKQLPHVVVYNVYSISECHDVAILALTEAFADKTAQFAPVGPLMENVVSALLPLSPFTLCRRRTCWTRRESQCHRARKGNCTWAV